MLGFMDYVQGAFYEATQWNRDNSYGSLTDTARGKPFFQFLVPTRFYDLIISVQLSLNSRRLMAYG